MQRSGKAFTNNLTLFVIAAVMTFGFITMLQFTPIPWFFIALVAMHGGIALFIISKRRFKKAGFSVSRYYKTQYLMLIPYVLIMLYAFASRADLLPLYEEAKILVTLAYTSFCAVMTTWNCLRMKKELERQYTLIAENDVQESKAAVLL